MKKLFLLSLLIVSGCASWSTEQEIAPVTEQRIIRQEPAQRVQPRAYTVQQAYAQDDYFGPASGAMQQVQYVAAPSGVAYETQTYIEQVQMQPTYAPVQQPMYAPVQPTYVQAQPIYAPTPGTQQVAVQPDPNYNPYVAQQVPINAVTSSAVIVLQHPTNRDLVKCDFVDYNCIGSYESQGYVQLRATPHFAGYNDVPSTTDYPPRRYRDNNYIPRW